MKEEEESERFDAQISGTGEIAIIHPPGKGQPTRIILGKSLDATQEVDDAVLATMFNHGLADVNDWVGLKGVTLGEIRAALDLAICLIEALQLAMMILEPDTDDDLRSEATGELEDCLNANEEVEARLRNILWAVPMPKSADMTKALVFTGKNQTPKSEKLYRQLNKQQTEIQAVRRIWKTIPTSLFGGQEGRQRFQVTLVRLGAFRRLAEGEDFEIVTQALADIPEARELPNFNNVIAYWRQVITGA